MLDKIKEFNKNYSNTVFLVIMIFILFSLIYISFNNRSKPKECVMPNSIVNNSLSYSYNVSVTSDGNDIAKLFVKKYDSKHLIELNMNDTKDTYYLNYTDFLIRKPNGRYSVFYKNELIDGLDNKYLIFDYINDLSKSSDVITKDERNCYINRKENVSMCINLDKSVELIKENYNLVYTIDTNYIDDFDVSIEKIDINEENLNMSE